MKKKKIKLRDITPEQWHKENFIIECNEMGIHSKCEECPFRLILCGISKENKNRNWVYNKDMFSDKFLNQEIEVEE